MGGTQDGVAASAGTRFADQTYGNVASTEVAQRPCRELRVAAERGDPKHLG